MFGKYQIPSDTTGLLMLQSGSFIFYGGGTTYHLTFSPTVPLAGAWYFFVAWYDATGPAWHLSINDESPSTAANGTPTLGTTPLKIGLNTDAITSFLDGRVDAFGFWSRTLTPTERTWLYNSGHGRRYSDVPNQAGLSTGLAEWWDMDEQYGDRVGSVAGTIMTQHNGVTRAAGVF